MRNPHLDQTHRLELECCTEGFHQDTQFSLRNVALNPILSYILLSSERIQVPPHSHASVEFANSVVKCVINAPSKTKR
jgi:hypothetical protein